ncbi:hypothetical protein GUJ93_ZPchr0013g37181 [Zizania palustris]|uniref:Uncharacterized protein n=1 Tax=Zizania palustris TaxID=103762 RepID=A0A8J6C035_ZIZPA|nr:hypothetical protein GUJ93_ZPchr0013g37181 [Zizania palustris]
MAGVQVMPAVGAVATVDVRAEGSRAAGLRRGRASGSGVSSASLFAGDWRRRPRRPACTVGVRQCRGRSKRQQGLAVVCNLGGDYEEGFEDVHVERQELAERVMITRLHLYSKWIKKCDHAKMYERISDENLLLMRERLMETVIWPADDTNT